MSIPFETTLLVSNRNRSHYIGAELDMERQYKISYFRWMHRIPKSV